MSKHYVNETGTDLILDTGVAIGTATDFYIKYKTPAGVEGTWTAAAYSSYSEIAGAIGTYFVKRTLTYSDLTVSGEWRFQPHVGAIDGTWWGETVKENIYGAFE